MPDSEVLLQEAALRAWDVVFGNVTRLLGDQLSTAQMHRLETLKAQFQTFWMHEPGPHYEEDLEIVKARVRHVVADAMLDASAALSQTVQSVLEIAVELAGALIQRLRV